MRLFHFSEEPDIREFLPRPVRTPAERPPGFDWLNGPLVWGIAGSHAHLYLFPRECPRILAWSRPGTTEADRQHWLGEARVVAWIEEDWFDRFRVATIYRYELPPDTFEDIGDVGMWVSRDAVAPIAMDTLSDLPARLAERGVELRQVTSLLPLRGIWQSSLHASGIRLRNAAGWGAPGWPHCRAGAKA